MLRLAENLFPGPVNRRFPVLLFLSAFLFSSVVILVASHGNLPAWRGARFALIHAGIYGLTFGFAMPWLGPRIFALRPPRDWIVLVITLFALSVFASFAIGMALVTFEPLRAGSFWRGVLLRLLTGLTVSLIIGASLATYQRFHRKIGNIKLALQAREKERENALKLAAETRLALFESHLHPHFLFNTLTSLSTLVSEDPRRAQTLILNLADLLRFSIDSAAKRLVPLDHEMKIVLGYLHIQNERLGNRLLSILDIHEDTSCLLIPPFSVQLLVENSVKHGIEPQPQGGTVQVVAHTAQGKLIVEVKDDGVGFPAQPLISGVGLHNLQSRLKLIFGDEGELIIDAQEAGSRVRIMVPCVTVATPHEN